MGHTHGAELEPGPFPDEVSRLPALKLQPQQVIAAFDEAEMDFRGSPGSFRYGGGRSLEDLAEHAHLDEVR